jgi:hypothetical protein
MAETITSQKSQRSKYCNVSAVYVGKTLYDKWGGPVPSLFDAANIKSKNLAKNASSFLMQLERASQCYSANEGGTFGVRAEYQITWSVFDSEMPFLLTQFQTLCYRQEPFLKCSAKSIFRFNSLKLLALKELVTSVFSSTQVNDPIREPLLKIAAWISIST